MLHSNHMIAIQQIYEKSTLLRFNTLITESLWSLHLSGLSTFSYGFVLDGIAHISLLFVSDDIILIERRGEILISFQGHI